MLNGTDKATEDPFIGKYDNFYEDGTFICLTCNIPLFSSKSKFDVGCGWPRFDESFQNAIKRIPDPDGIRTEIQCENFGAHLGHEFRGEHLTDKSTPGMHQFIIYTLCSKRKRVVKNNS